MSSFFFYIHDDLSGDENFKKAGKSMTPYSAVRARQKFCSKKFYLNHLWMGNPDHIDFLENQVKSKLYFNSAIYLNGVGATEVFNIEENLLVEIVNQIIIDNELNIAKLNFETPYSASRSSDCPLKIPSEKESKQWLTKFLAENTEFSNLYQKKRITTQQTFEKLFEYK